MNRPLRFPLRTFGTTSVWKWFRWLLFLGILAAVAIGVRMVQIEMDTSRLQARYLSELTRDVGFTVADGPSDNIRFPTDGPYDIRLGYALLPAFERRLKERGFAVASQARDSERMAELSDEGLFIPYEEKDRAGLMLYDSTGARLFGSQYPSRAYEDFDAVPPLVVSALLYIEDRHLLDADQPNRNPAIDWGRFSRALMDQGVRVFNHHQPQPGGSTLATQIEKFRHSPGGRTATPKEKIRQIASASVRAYLDGPRTMPARQQIVVRYLNSVPLAAQPGVGEINGIGDGLAAWYGRDFDEVNRVLKAPPTPENLAEQGLAFRQVLSLMIAQRGPSHFLLRNNNELNTLTESYLRLFAANGVITPQLRDAALAHQLVLTRAKLVAPEGSYVERKAVTSLRTHLMASLGVSNLYDLDRLDLRVTSTMNNKVQQDISVRLADATTRDGAQAAGLYGFNMLQPKDDPSKIAFSFTLFEKRNGENLLRVQTDSVNRPFDINSGARLNLGSTAKLRTIITYLQIVTELHDHYGQMSNDELRAVKPEREDALTRWAVDYFVHTKDHSLDSMLDASVERKYSGNAGEVFYTGGGEQTFTNFEADENSRILTVRQAFEHSVNLVFVRMMRDIVHYETIKVAGPSSQWLDNPDTRKMYLTRFADQESRVYMNRFYTKYHGKTQDEMLAALLHGVRKSPPKLATVLRSVRPDGSQAWFDEQMRAQLKNTPKANPPDDALAQLYTKYGVDKFSLSDRAYISSVHPLELWLVDYLRMHPDATTEEVMNASQDVRVESYKWLFKTRYYATQNRRIRRMVEQHAYEAIGKSWQALGYPFAHLTPSYAAAIGASGDRPLALAELIGIVANNGEQIPAQSLSELEFAKGTPYETRFVHAAAARPDPGVSPDIARVVKSLLRDVVAGGTAKRLAGGMVFPDGTVMEVYGKTGTGDQRLNIYAKGRRLIESKKVNRTATFVFVIGDRFYGSLTAVVHEPFAKRYDFTSALAVQLLKSMAPVLQPLVVEGPSAKR